MSSVPRMCFDKILPRKLHRPPQRSAERRLDGVARALMPRSKKWAVGSTLRVRFMGGTKQQHDLVERVASTWCTRANLNFTFDNSPRAEIRISFDPGDGSWSYLGIECREIPLHAATMNLGWLDEAVILHEFGHAIGLAHEHQNPDGGIEWNAEVVIRELSGAPNYWDEETVRQNVLEKYAMDHVNGTRFDPDSIMLYAFPGTWTKSGQGTKENEKLSALDREFISGPLGYPGREAQPKPAAPLTVTQIARHAGSIARPGEQDLFTFQVEAAGLHTIETEGATDLVMKLFGPNSATEYIADDDDSGTGTNARIARDLAPGTYFVELRHYSEQHTGDYRIKVCV